MKGSAALQCLFAGVPSNGTGLTVLTLMSLVSKIFASRVHQLNNRGIDQQN